MTNQMKQHDLTEAFMVGSENVAKLFGCSSMRELAREVATLALVVVLMALIIVVFSLA